MCDLDKIDNVKEWFSILCICHNVQSSVVRTKLLLTKDLTFQMAVDIIMEEEKAAKTAKQMASGSADPYVAATSTYRADRNASNQNRQNGQGGQQQQQVAQQSRGRSQSRNQQQSGQRSSSSSQRPIAGGPVCGQCGYVKHTGGAVCPAKMQQCRKCSKDGHYSRMCKSGKKFVNRLENEDADPTMGHVYISNSITATEPLELIEVSFKCKTGKAIHVRALPDTGANITAISPETFKQTGNSFMKGTAASPKSADGAKMKTSGKAMFCVEYKDKVVETEVYIVQGLEKPILSLAMLKKLKLVPEDFPHAQVAAAALDEKVEPAPVFTGRGPELDAL